MVEQMAQQLVLGRAASTQGSGTSALESVERFLTGGGEYAPATEVFGAAGNVDWLWVWLTALLSLGLVAWAIGQYAAWRRSARREAKADRNRSLMAVTSVLLGMVAVGYGLPVALLFWPGHRLAAGLLLVLNVWAWFVSRGQHKARSVLTAARAEREARDAIARRDADLKRMVAERTAALEEARLAAEDASVAKTAFLATVGEEMREPMSAILGFAELLKEQQGAASDRSAFAQRIRQNGEHLLAIVNDVLDLSRIESGRLELSIGEHAVGPIVAEAVESVRLRAEAKGLELRVEEAGGLPAVLVDRERVRQVTQNLVSNAVKFTDQGSVRVVVSWARERQDLAGPEGRVSIRVRDTGVGMDQKTVEGLFEPFAARGGERRRGGTGLGLSVSRSLAQAMGGDISVESRPNAGSTFTFALRAAEASAPAAVRMAQPAAAEEATGKLSGLRVLLAEDGEDTALLISTQLRRAGATVAVSIDGAQAIETVDAAERSGSAFDVVLMDAQMPVMDGAGATKQLRDRGFRLPVIALAPEGMSGDHSDLFAAGCDQVIPKPVDHHDLIQRLARIAGRRRAA